MSTSVLMPVAEVRKFESKDVQALTGLMRELCYPMTESVLRDRMAALEGKPQFMTLVAEREGQVVGMIALYRKTSYDTGHKTSQITGLVISEAYRNQGIGRELITTAERQAREAGDHSVFVTGMNRDERLSSCSFYQHMGYEKIGCNFIKQM
ncbi:GNAT family N-acetyltransferase [Paenibacillus dauci]|uniref:GNAT family N-acetyltransferase n=1 Tax=Paenibacillus dauci TaxID=1567106 RepID=UPI0006985EB8|nr:GNAT family N-acetyltransferase [Paenibacillus dauci]